MALLGLAALASTLWLHSSISKAPGPAAASSQSSSRAVLNDDNCHDESHVTIIPGLNGKCNASWEEAGSGVWASLLYIVIVVYIFLGVAILCDNAFTDSLEMICSEHGLNLSEDVAGATFMAAGSSAPELATSFVGVFIAKNDVGLGTILGSAVFNILIIIGATAMLAGQTLSLDWRPIVRDNFFYSISVVILCLCVVFDDKIQWYDAMIMLLWYICYVTFMFFNEAFWARVAPKEESESGTDEDRIVMDMSPDEPKAPPKKVRHASFSSGTWRHSDDEEEDDEDVVDRILAVLSAPWEFLYQWTIPDCHLELLDEEEDAELIGSLQQQADDEQDPELKQHKLQLLRARTEPEYSDLTCGQRWYALSFAMSLVWLTILSYLMVEFILKLGCLWNLSAVVMGLTFLAMGTSIPDALGSIAVARSGQGDMAVSNAVGSNVFDICLGLGLPWFIDTAIVHPGKTFQINNTGEVIPSILILLGIIVVLFMTFVASEWQLKSWVGYVLFGTYFVFIIYQIVRAKVNDDC